MEEGSNCWLQETPSRAFKVAEHLFSIVVVAFCIVVVSVVVVVSCAPLFVALLKNNT
jgi:hypothetical protein